jgi:RES domain-containing protein
MADFEPDPRLAEALARLEETGFQGRAWKHTLPNQSPTAANTKGARWNPAGVPVIYLSVERDTARAEGDYLGGAQPQPIRGTRHITEVEISLGRVLDLRDRTVLRALGLSEADLRSSDHSACQRVGGTAEWLGLEGLIVPSARAEGANVVVFERRTGPDFSLRVVGSEPLE